LAPSPTGAIHLGNARTFLLNWALARQLGWRIRLRIEDLDGPRVKPGADRQAIEDLQWLGLDWEQPPLRQRADLTPYQAALAALHAAGRIYPCICTRSDIVRAGSAPHGDEHELRYPGTCRPCGDARNATARVSGSMVAWRLIVPEEVVTFDDQTYGPQRDNVQQQVGDFLVATKAGVPAYQLAVVVDDARQGVTDVVRGDDLLSSTARQVLLYRFLGLGPIPRYWHLPLVLGPDGRRLAKRHGDTRLAWFRTQGVSPQRIIGLIAAWSGVLDRPQPMTIRELADRFDFARLPRQPVVCTQEHVQWLLSAV
jgi:glutamyl-tRNA synthetase